MRHLIDTYIRAEESRKVTDFDDLSLVQLIVERGVEAVDSLPEAIRKKDKAVTDAIKSMVDQTPIECHCENEMAKD
jgi:type I restriction enzyme R subunit